MVPSMTEAPSADNWPLAKHGFVFHET